MKLDVTIYSKSNCPNCVTAKQLLQRHELPYVELSVDDESTRAAFAQMYPDIRQMPQIFINGQRVGGLAGLQAALGSLAL